MTARVKVGEGGAQFFETLWSSCFWKSGSFIRRWRLCFVRWRRLLSVIGICVCNPDRSPVGINRWTQPQLQPAFFRLQL